MRRLVALMMCAVSLGAVAQQLPGFNLVFETDSTGIFVSTDKLIWAEAQGVASAFGGHLVTISDEQENAGISSALSAVPDQGYWIGLEQEGSAADPTDGWGWVTGEPVTYTNWSNDEPGDEGGEEVGLENCAEVSHTGGWNDAPCQGDRYFLIELTLPIVAGCTNSAACNFSQEATENDGSCTYAEPPFDCNGDCLNDADGDGVCDEFEVPGCDDELACNFVSTATENDGSCTYPGDPCDDGDPQTLEDVLDEACDCVDASSIDGIGAAAWVGLEVYPNPVEDVLTVVLPLDASHALSLVSLSGQTVVAHQTAVRGTLQWPLGHLPAGVYLLHVTGAERTATRRVVVTGQ